MITIHEAKAADFATLGLGALLPSECTVRERAGGMYELKIVHPITDDGRHRRIKPMRVIKAPAPVRETPLVEIGQTGTIYRDIYKVVTDGRRLYLRVKPDQESKGLHAYKPGTEVVSMELSDDGKWRRVAILDGGATGWMWAGNLEFVRTETEIIVGDTPGGIVQPRQTREQLFRIYRYSPDSKERAVTAEARHITYDLAGAVVDGKYSPENVPANQVCAQIMARADHDVSDFHIYCTITDPISGEYGGRNILDCLLDPETGIVAQTKARIVRDNYDIFILPDDVRSRGVELRYGKNLLSAYMDTDTSNTITRIKPVGKNKDGEPLYVEDNGGWVESPYINDYPVVYSKEIEYDVVESDDLPINQARALLKEKAEADFIAGCDAATVRLDADFVRLELTEEYKHLANQYALHLYDSVPVIDREADIVATARMTEYVYDAILDEYQDTGLGELDEVKSTIYGYELASGTVSGGKLIPNTVNGDRLQNLSVSYGKFDLAAIKQLSADAITAIRADIRELVAGNITTDQLYADLAVIAAAQITAANIEKANIKWAEIENLTVEIAKVVNAEIKNAKIDWAQIENAEIDAADIANLSAAVAAIVKAEIALAEIDWAQIKNAEIDTAQIKLGAITSALIKAGAIGTAQIADGSITSAKIVELTADLIKTGTLSVERLLLKGKDGLFYAINATAGGLTSTQLTEEQYKNAISGTALVARSVTAEKIAAKTITANEILSGTITAAEINVANLFAAEATIAALNSYLLKADTIEALEKKLELWAEEKIQISVGGLRAGGTNLLIDSKELKIGTKADEWRVTAEKVTRYGNVSGFYRLQLTDSGQTADKWAGAYSPVKRLPDGWYGKEVTLTAWIWSENWAAVDRGITWSVCLTQGGADRLNYGSKYSLVVPGKAELGADAKSDTTLANSKWVRVSTTFKLDETGMDQGSGTLRQNTHILAQFFLRRNGEYRIYAPMMEFGNLAGDWSPAPEDTEAATRAAIKVTQKDIMLVVDGKADKGELDTGTDGGVRAVITKDKFSVDVPGEDGDFELNKTGAKVPVLIANRIEAPNVAPRYEGPAALTVDPAATSAQIAAGNYFRSLADALAKLNGKWLPYSVTISMKAGMEEFGTLQTRGMAGNGQIIINGNGAKLTGQMLVNLMAVPVMFDGLNVDVPANGYGFDVGNGSVYAQIKSCVINGGGSGWGVRSMHGSQVTVNLCELYGLTRSLYTQYGGRLYGKDNKGDSVVASASGGMMNLSGTQPCPQEEWIAYTADAGQIFLQGTSISGGTTPPKPTEPETGEYLFTASDSYAGGWDGFTDDDIRQGYNGSKRIFGCIWFDTAKMQTDIGTKTIKQASLRLHMQKNIGRGVNVAVQLWGTKKAYGSGLTGEPTLDAEYGTIGTTEPGEINEITIPAQAIRDMVSNGIKALVLYSDDKELYGERPYSRNYAKFSGSTTASGDTRPMLTVVYQ